MTDRANAFLRRQQAMWLRPDAARWIRPDAARFLATGANLAEAFPALAYKYSQNQPRVPAGNGSESGRWTDGNGGGQQARPRVVIDTTDFDDQSMGDVSDEIGSLNLFGITPRERLSDGLQLAGDPPIGDSPQVPPDEPPEIPQKRPQTSTERTKFLRAASNWLARSGPVAGEVFAGALKTVEWLQDYHDLIEANRDPPKAFEELREGVRKRRPGYDDHHIVEQTLAERFGFSRSEIDDPLNIVSIPRLKHYQITGWYGTPNPDFGYSSPREYLADKSWDERMSIGRSALVRFEVMKP